ncbi:MAG: response regulator [Butyrivibrio sp.]|nr:response regulator [Butyrivibrio sp.]
MGVFSRKYTWTGFKTAVRIAFQIIGIIVFAALTAASVASSLRADFMTVSSGRIVLMAFAVTPFLLLGGLYGYVISMASFMISFTFCLVLDMSNAYKMAIFLVPAICFSLFSQYLWFDKVKKTVLAGVITLALTGFIEMACLTIVPDGAYSVEEIMAYGMKLGTYFTRDAVAIFGCGFLLHIYFTKVPDICKMMFPLAIGYTRVYRDNRELQRDLRKTRVGMKISLIIIGVELILSISVGVFMIVLFPDLKEMMISNIDPKSVVREEPTTTQQFDFDDDRFLSEADREAFVDHIQSMEFSFNVKAFGYDVKMVLMMLCIGVPLAAFAHYYAKTAIGMPLGMMSDFMNEYAGAPDDMKLEVGKKADRLMVRSHDEIRVVNDSIKATVKSVEEYIGRLHEEQELEKELEVAQKASEAKSSFLSNMSHEIRTPINAVLGMNEMILRESAEPQILEYAQNVKSAGNALLSIINDILDFSKIEAGKMDILPVEYHLSSTINDLINMISAKADDKGLALEVNVDKNTPNILFGDEVRIKQCVTNVLSNAVKYTERGSITMNVSFRDIDEESIGLRFRVVDTGIGIKEEDINKLFSPFERIEEIRNRSIEGTGLGMSIVKKLLAMMDTKLEVKSIYGEGSDFSFEVVQKVVDRAPIGDFKTRYREYLDSLEKYHEAFHAPDAQILVVDDTTVNLTVVKGLLKATQIKVDTAESGRETLEKVTKKKYDAIFIDHRMPEMDGLETLAAMKTLERNLNVGVPCIALTANAGSGARDEYMAAGFDDYLAKPVNGKDLEKMLKDYLPKDKLKDAGDGKADDDFGGTTKDPEKDDSGDEDFLPKLLGIDLAEAEKNCGSKDVLREVVKEFLVSIDPKADNIEQFAAGKDLRNYTVAVHALKSSARLIGAMELSSMAAGLEEAGNAEDIHRIEEKTPQLLELYRSYKDKLSAACEPEDDDKPEISKEELMGAFSDMKELLEAYDFDTADGIMSMLSDYRIPDDLSDKYNKVKELMAAVDRDGLMEIL